MQANIYNTQGKKVDTVTLPESIFDVPWNGDLVHSTVFAMQANARTNVAHAKDRGAVRGGGKKPWRQKGTGRARHGSIRSPIWIGGGVTHGPLKEKDYTQKINKKMKVRALCAVLSQKMRDGEILFIDEMNFSEKKTKHAKEILMNLSSIEGFDKLSEKKSNAALITTSTPEENTYKSFSNFNNVAIEEARNLNPVDLLQYKYVIMANPQETVDFLKSKINTLRSTKTYEPTNKEVSGS